MENQGNPTTAEAQPHGCASALTSAAKVNIYNIDEQIDQLEWNLAQARSLGTDGLQAMQQDIAANIEEIRKHIKQLLAQ